MVDVAHPTLRVGYEATQASLPLVERQPTLIDAVNTENVESVEDRPLATEEQGSEVGPAIGLDARDLAVQDGALGAHDVPQLLGELGPLLEHVAVPRD